MITAATYLSNQVFRREADVAYLHDLILMKAEEHGWRLEAWAVLSNHYHIVGRSPDIVGACDILTKDIHIESATEINKRHNELGRRVWYRSWPTLLTFEKSYLARLSYVHRNAVKHGLVAEPWDYPYCSARWFLENTQSGFAQMVLNFPTSRANIADEYDVVFDCEVSG